jgi:hypothetical protein
MKRDHIAATIAYSLYHLTFEQRMFVAERFAAEMRLTGKRRSDFIQNCKTLSEAKAGA